MKRRNLKTMLKRRLRLCLVREAVKFRNQTGFRIQSISVRLLEAGHAGSETGHIPPIKFLKERQHERPS